MQVSRTYIPLYWADVYDERKGVIGCVTPQQPGFFVRMYSSTFFCKIAEDTQQGKKQTNRDVSPRIHTPWYLCVYTNSHTYSKHTRQTLSSSRAQQTVKDKTEWKGGENRKMEKQSISVWQRRDGQIGGGQKTARKVKLRPHPLRQTIKHQLICVLMCVCMED